MRWSNPFWKEGNAMKIALSYGGAWDTSADLLLTRDGVSTVTHSFGLSIPFLRIACPLRGLAPLRLFKKGTELGAPPLPCAPSYHILTDAALPPIDAQRLYQYVIAGNGVFVLARSQEVELCLPLLSRGTLPQLADVTPFVHFRYPRVGVEIVAALLARARAAGYNERLFCLLYRDHAWQIHEPPQQATREQVHATTMTPEYLQASLVGHSHHEMDAYFSHGDDQDEMMQGWFKIFFVLGTIFTLPHVWVRICAHGYCWDVDASIFFCVPAHVHDRWKGNAP
jgi:hypothetical protein